MFLLSYTEFRPSPPQIAHFCRFCPIWRRVRRFIRRRSANAQITRRISATLPSLIRCTYIETALECRFFVRTLGEAPLYGWFDGCTYIETALECRFFVRTSGGELRKSPLAPRWRRFSRRWRRFSRRCCRFSRRWCRFHFRAETCTTGATQKADSRCRFRPCFGTCAVDTRNLRRLPRHPPVRR